MNPNFINWWKILDYFVNFKIFKIVKNCAHLAQESFLFFEIIFDAKTSRKNHMFKEKKNILILFTKQTSFFKFLHWIFPYQICLKNLSGQISSEIDLLYFQH